MEHSIIITIIYCKPLGSYLILIILSQDNLFNLMQISSFIFDSYSINLCLGYQLCLIYLLIPLYFSIHLHRYPGIFLPNVWTLPSESCLPFCLEKVYSYLCGQGWGRNIGGSGGIPGSLWRSLKSTIRMRRP